MSGWSVDSVMQRRMPGSTDIEVPQAMKPRRVVQEEERKCIRRMLADFYARKPPEYDLMSRPQSEYNTYSKIISQYAPSQGRVLDFGCGTWRSPHTIASSGFQEVIGCDVFSDKELATYQSMSLHSGVRFVPYDGGRLPFPDAHFDVVASLCVLEHVIDVEHVLLELHRVLKSGGAFVIMGPNWSGLNNPIRGLVNTMMKGERYWQYETPTDALWGIARVFGWYVEVLMAEEPRFLTIHPLSREGKIFFETGDDDCVHLCHPLSFKKWLFGKNYSLLKYNRLVGATSAARAFNTILPSLATTNVIVGRKPLPGQ